MVSATIGRDVNGVGRGAPHVVKNHRQGALSKFLDQGIVHFRNDHGKAQQAAAQHRVHARNQALGAITRAFDDHLVAAAVGDSFETAEDIEEVGILEVGNDHADRATAGPCQGFGMNVRVVLEFPNGF
jgi:hypothetical protein